MTTQYQPKTGVACSCKPGIQRDNCPHCEGTGQRIDFAAIRARRTNQPLPPCVEFKYRAQPETTAALESVPVGTVSERAAKWGAECGEPLLVIADALLRYAKTYRKRFESPVFNDGVGGGAFLNMLRGLKVFLDFDGGTALDRNVTTDSKDNRAMCEIIEAICRHAGIDYDDL